MEKYFRLAWHGDNALKFHGLFMGNPFGRPDILIPGLRAAVEFDGRMKGKSARGHVTRDGKQMDILKDEMVRAVGWEVVRVRTGRMGMLGPFDVKVGGEIGTENTPTIVWSVIKESLKLDTLINNLEVLKPLAEDLILAGPGTKKAPVSRQISDPFVDQLW